MVTPIVVNAINRLRLHVFVIGYYPMGECSFVVLSDADTSRVFFSMVIDFYEQKNNKNHLKTLLDQFRIDESKLSCVIWTHPDKDHSIGLNTICSSYVNKETLFVLPEGLSTHYFTFSIGVIKSWLALLWHTRRAKNTIRESSLRGSLVPNNCFNRVFTDGINRIPLSIDILTPIKQQVFSKTEVLKSRKPNDISISCILRAGKMGFYFGGDSENPAIVDIPSERFLDTILFKIPHHGSSSSDKLPEVIKSLRDIEDEEYEDSLGFPEYYERVYSISTSFVHGKTVLPEEKVLRSYSEVSSQVLLTSKKEVSHSFGIWEVVFNPFNNSYVETNNQGDASIWNTTEDC